MIRETRRADRPAPRHGRLMAFGRAEEGTLTILGLFMFIMMFAAGGVALDVMRSERQRVNLQTTIDRGVLAASSLDQPRPGDVVMRDYLQAAGIDSRNMTITASDDGSTRTVSVDATAVMPSLFMGMLGVDELTQPVRTSAIEQRTELELSLVVDISGSMDGAKIARLREAASDFVANLLQGREDRTTISLIPYNETVNLGSVMPRYFPMTTEHDYSRCVVFADEAFRRMDLPAGTPLERKGHFDKSSGSMQYGPIRAPECPTDDRGAVMLWSNDVAELQRQIMALRSGGSTAINVGAKVGTLLLDPSARGRLTAMTNDATLPASLRLDPIFVGRPVDYGTSGTHKVLVLMTDGTNNTQHDLRAPFKSGPSTVAVMQDRIGKTCDDDGDPTDCADYDAAGPAAAGHPFGSPSNPNSGNSQPGTTMQPRYSFWSDSRGEWYIHHLKAWQDKPWGGTEAMTIDWPTLLAHRPIKEMADGLLRDSDAATRQQYRDIFHATHTSNQLADRNLRDICAAARDKGVVVYTIAFQASSGGRAAMRDCAGPDNAANYFDVNGLDIEQAFADVLAAVSRLRLIR